MSIRIGYEDLNGEDVLALTKSQVTKISKAYESGKGTTIKMSKSQLAHNMKVEGVFLGMYLKVCILRRVGVFAELKLMGKGCTWDL